MNSALVLVDIQNDYFKGGRNELYQPERAAENAARALAFFRSSGQPIFHVQHISMGAGATFFLPDSTGADIHPSVAPAAGEKVLVKHVPNSFFGTGLADELTRCGAAHIVVCGMMSHMCVDTTVRAAKDFGLAVTLLEDACATKNLVWRGAVVPAETVHSAFMASLSGVFAKVLRTDEFLHKQ
jgi:nicotinamidase-related amidase